MKIPSYWIHRCVVRRKANNVSENISPPSSELKSKQSMLPASCSFLLDLLFDPEDWCKYVPPKGRLTFTRLQGVITQETEIS
jgi:hypothetical protein